MPDPTPADYAEEARQHAQSTSSFTGVASGASFPNGANGYSQKAANSEIAAEAAMERAESLADNSAIEAVYTTRAAADAALSGLDPGMTIEVTRDEDNGGGRFRYPVISGPIFGTGVPLPILDTITRVKGSGGGLDVTMRGAVLDDSASATADTNRAALLDAVDRVEIGGEVYVPPGTLHVTPPGSANDDGLYGIEIDKQVRIYGPGAIRLAPSVATFDYVLKLAVDDSRLDRVTISAEGAAFGGGRGEIVRVDGDRVRLRGVSVRGTGAEGSSANGFFLRGAYPDLEGCDAYDAGYAGFRLCVSPHARIAGFRSFGHLSRVGVVSGQGVDTAQVTSSASSGSTLDVNREFQIGDILGVNLGIAGASMDENARLYRVSACADLGGGEWRVTLAKAYHPSIDSSFFFDFPLAPATIDLTIAAGTKLNYVEGTADLSDIFGRSDASASVDSSGGIVVDPEPVILRRLNLSRYTLDGTYTSAGLKIDFVDTSVLHEIDVSGRPNVDESWFALSTGGVYERNIVIKDSRFRGPCFVSRSLRHLSIEDTTFDVQNLGATRGDYNLGLGAERMDIRRTRFWGGYRKGIELRDPDAGEDAQFLRVEDVEFEGNSDSSALVGVRSSEPSRKIGENRVERIRDRITRGVFAPTATERLAVAEAWPAPVTLLFDSGHLGFCTSSEGGNAVVAGLDCYASSGVIAKTLSGYTWDADGLDLTVSRAVSVTLDTSSHKRFRLIANFGVTTGRALLAALDSEGSVLAPATADPGDVAGKERDLIEITSFGGAYSDGNDVAGVMSLTFEVTDQTQKVRVGVRKGTAACTVKRIRVYAVGTDSPVSIAPETWTPEAAGLSEQSSIPDGPGFEGQAVLDSSSGGAWRYSSSTWSRATTLEGGHLTDHRLGNVARGINQQMVK